MLLWGCFRYAKKLLPFVIPVAILLMLSTVYLRAHYVIDIIAAVLTTPLVFLASSALYKKITKKPGPEIRPVTHVQVSK